MDADRPKKLGGRVMADPVEPRIGKYEMKSFVLPDLLFHYTSQNGLLGIFSSKAIWATNLHYLNDYKEFQHAIDVANSVVWNWSYKTEEGLGDSSYNKFKDILERISKVSIFVTSFTERGDLLSQWRGYCNGGPGYSIGFEKSIINGIGVREGFTLTSCIYDYGEQKIIVEAIFKNTFLLVLKNKKKTEIEESEIEAAAWAFVNSFVVIAPRFKSPAFSEEKEWRLISGLVTVNDPRLNFRSGNSGIVPYIPVKLAAETDTVPVKEIVVGPNPHMYMSTNAISSFLSSQNVNNWSVRPSQVPYRNW